MKTTHVSSARRLPLLLVAVLSLASLFCATGTVPVGPEQSPSDLGSGQNQDPEEVAVQVSTQDAVPTLTSVPPASAAEATPGVETLAESQPELVELYQQVSPGVVNIQVFVNSAQGSGMGAGSGFILDTAGHIVTNNHVVEGATTVVVVFFDGTEATAEVVGLDPDSDLAVLRASRLPEGTHPLPMGDSSAVQIGQWVVAIGNPFGVGTSMSIGIVSATGRAIESGATPFSIPEAIQTDAAINPGNSGGPLLNLNGEVIGVNAQIATAGTSANSGVGFAIPGNVVRRVAPVLIASGAYQWPWLGIEGEDVNLLIAEANELASQEGAYIHGVVQGGPAAEAGLRGSQGEVGVDGVAVPTGGDIVLEAGGQPVRTFNDLLAIISSRNPGDELPMTVIRDGQQQQVTVVLQPRPNDDFGRDRATGQ